MLRSQVLQVLRHAENALGSAPTVEFTGPVDASVPEAVLPDVLAVVRGAVERRPPRQGERAVRVEVAVSEDLLLVAVSDNGVGIEPSIRSSGLANLEERARLRGGELEVQPAPGGGTRLEWRVSLGL